jgi:hypothetical protein
MKATEGLTPQQRMTRTLQGLCFKQQKEDDKHRTEIRLDVKNRWSQTSDLIQQMQAARNRGEQKIIIEGELLNLSI